MLLYIDLWTQNKALLEIFMDTEKKCLIIPWNDESLMKFFATLAPRLIAAIDKKRKYYENLTVAQLKNNKDYLDNIKGVTSRIPLWELKFPSDPPHRAICIIKENKIIILLMFQGSGSNGKVMRWVPYALKNVEKWLAKNQF